MTRIELVEYFFPNDTINEIREKYFPKLKKIIGIENFFGYKDYTGCITIKSQITILLQTLLLIKTSKPF